MIYLLNKNNMKKLAYIATIACSMFLTTSCVDLTQEPQSFICLLYTSPSPRD